MDIFSISLWFFVILGFSIFAGSYFDAMWLPTKRANYDRIAKLSQLKHGMLFYDIGSGSANMLFYLSKKYDVNCVGIEIAPFWYLYSKIKSLFYKKVKIKYGNFYKHNLSAADVVYVFLLPKNYSKIKNKTDKELKKEAKLILSSWPLKGVEPFNVDERENSISYYLYIK